MRLEKIVSDALANTEDDGYLLSIVVAKRANQLAEGAQPLIKADKNKEKLTDIALKEVAQGVIVIDKIIPNE